MKISPDLTKKELEIMHPKSMTGYSIGCIGGTATVLEVYYLVHPGQVSKIAFVLMPDQALHLAARLRREAEQMLHPVAVKAETVQ